MRLVITAIIFHVGLDFTVFVERWSYFDRGQEGRASWDWTSPPCSTLPGVEERDLWH